VQVHEHVAGEEIFSHYAYFSSYSDSWLAHAATYVDMISERLNLNETSHVVEVASNDGYLLQNFVKKEIPCLGIEPAANVAQVAIDKGIPVDVNFFGVETAKRIASEGKSADLLIANNCLAHVPDLNDFVGGMKEILADGGIVNVEYPHLLNIIEQNHLDTIYQEHYCYHSLYTLEQVFAHHGMRIFDVEEISTHGGSLRIYVSHDNDDSKPVTAAVHEIRQREIDRGLTQLSTFHAFADRVKQTKWNLVEFLINARRDGKRVVGYGAPGKGNTMLNYCGIREDLLDFTVDRNPFKQDSFLVGSRIPVYAPEMIDEFKPDYVLIMPWNLRDEIVEQMKHIREWGGQFVVAIPELEVI
jgi:SAM-dependent methyltransferase